MPKWPIKTGMIILTFIEEYSCEKFRIWDSMAGIGQLKILYYSRLAENCAHDSEISLVDNGMK